MGNDDSATGRVAIFPVIRLLPSGVYDTGEIAERVAEADLVNHPNEAAGEPDEDSEPSPKEDQ